MADTFALVLEEDIAAVVVAVGRLIAAAAADTFVLLLGENIVAVAVVAGRVLAAGTKAAVGNLAVAAAFVADPEDLAYMMVAGRRRHQPEHSSCRS